MESSAKRLWRMIEERTKDNADVEAIDRRIWDMFGGDWAIMFTDLAGFSRHVAKFGITHFMQVIYEQQRLLVPVVEAHDGIVVKTEADSFLILFKRAPTALAAAVAMQEVCKKVNTRRPEEEQIILCVGIGFGHVLKIGDEDVYGHEVNLASKLGEDIARGGEILLTPGAHAACPHTRVEEIAHAYVGENLYYRVAY